MDSHSQNPLANARTPAGPRLPKFHSLLPRLLLCLVTAVAITMTSLICAWYNFRSIHYLRWQAFMTQERLDDLREQIAHYRAETGHVPARLGDLERVKNEHFLVDDAGRPLDYWNRPLHYDVKADHYELYSLGRDGQPGGFGLDADLYAGQKDQFWDRRHWLTFWQFLCEPSTRNMKLICIGAGILVFPIWLQGVTNAPRDRLTRRSDIHMDLVGHVVTAVFAIVTAVVISGLHIPSGH